VNFLRGLAVLVAVASVCFMPSIAAEPQKGTITLTEYLGEVGQYNLDLAAQKYNVSIAEAQRSIAALFPDPIITAGIGSTQLNAAQRPASPTQTVASLGWTIELGGKRSARIALAEGGIRKADADLQEFLRNLRATAANAFIETLRTRLVLQRTLETSQSLRRLVAVNERRYQSGDIGRVELLQSQVEADRFVGNVASAEAAVRVAENAMALPLGRSLDGRVPTGDIRPLPMPISPQRVLDIALERRADLVAARAAVDVAREQLALARANRWVDVAVNLGVAHTPAIPVNAGLEPAGNPVTPAFTSNTLGAVVTVPIPLSRLQQGELIQASAILSQSELQLKSTELKVRTEVDSAVAQYEAAERQLMVFQDGILKNADAVLGGMRYSYTRGNSSLLDLLNAQRTADSVYLSYFDALANYGKAVVALQQAAGDYDISF